MSNRNVTKPQPALSDPATVPHFLSREVCAAIRRQMNALGLPGSLESWWRGDVRWARNRIIQASDWRTNQLSTALDITLNQVDAASLRAAANRIKETNFLSVSLNQPSVAWKGTDPYPATPIWSEATYTQMPEERTRLVVQAVAAAEQAGMLSAGFLAVEAHSYEPGGGYVQQTLAQCSLTVRDPKGTGSGWAGASSFDWSRIDMAKLAAVALDKCIKSRNPVKLEPGRYTTILEPQAVYGLVSQLFNDSYNVGNMDMRENEKWNFDSPPPAQKPFRDWPPTFTSYPVGPFDHPDQYGKTRIGQKVIDSRFTLRSDPLDPELGTLPFGNTPNSYGDPFVPVTWVEHGVLKTLAMPGTYGVKSRLQRAQPWPFTPFHSLEAIGLSVPFGNIGALWGGAYRLEWSDPPVSVEEMIASTKRGLLVTRFWDVRVIHSASVLCTGTTRDGLWLIENGKVSHPVQNFRFTEPAFSALNNVEQAGTPVPIFNTECPAVIPPLKVQDFNFTSLIDAV